MSPRAFLILLVITAIAVVGAIAAAVQPSLSEPESGGGDPMFPVLAQRAAEARRIVVETPDYSATWEFLDGLWVDAGRGNYPGRQSAVAELVTGLASLTRVEPKTANPEWYRYIRVGDPTAQPPTAVAHITVSGVGGTVLADAILGTRSYSIPASHARGGSFAREANDGQSWLVEGSVSLPSVLPDWFETLVNIPGTNVASIAVIEGGKTVFEAERSDPTTGTYSLVSVDAPDVPTNAEVNATAVRGLASAIVGVRAEDVRALEGLTVPETARTNRFTTVTGLQVDMTVVDAEGGPWTLIKASAPTESAAAEEATAINARTAHWAFKLDSSRISRLTRKVSELVQDPEALSEGAVELPGMVVPGGPQAPNGAQAPEAPPPDGPAPAAL